MDIMSRPMDSAVDSGQLPLFDLPEAAGVKPGQQISPNYPSVNLGIRARSLLATLDALCAASRREGLQAAMLSQQHRPRIEDRYTGSTAQVVAAAAENIELFTRRAREHFAIATRHHALIAAGVDPEEVKEGSRQDFAKFESSFIGPQKRAARFRYRGRLHRYKNPSNPNPTPFGLIYARHGL